MKAYTPKLLEFFVREAVDDDGQPLRTPDPFAPPVLHKAVGSSTGGAGLSQKSQQRTAPSPNAPPPPASRTIPPQAKPQYKGSYVGQTQTTNGQMDYKNVSWKDKASGENRYGKTPSMQKVTLVWDGNDWIPQQEFNHKAKTGQLKKK